MPFDTAATILREHAGIELTEEMPDAVATGDWSHRRARL
jgi:hypothetical protein